MNINQKLISTINLILSDLKEKNIKVKVSKKELHKDILNIENIKLFNTYELMLMIYKKLDALNLIDLEFIHTIIFDDMENDNTKVEFIDPIENKELICKM